MNKSLMLLLVIVLLCGCGGKKDKETDERPVFIMGSCPVSKIEITPARSEDPQSIIGSNTSIQLTATATDHNGRTVEPDLSWGFRYPDGDDRTLAGAGHRLEVLDKRRARFNSSGLAPGTFTVIAQDQSCNLLKNDETQYVEGQARIKVQGRPGDTAACGRMRVTYGDDIDRMGDTVIASSKVTLIAEVSGPQKLPRHYKVRFLINDDPHSLRPLYREPTVSAAPGMSTGYKALLPIYLVPRQYRVRYELVENGEVVCASRTERFAAR